MINKTNINKVLNKLPKDKVELEKVQLSVSDDLGKMVSALEKAAQQEKELLSEIKEVTKVEKEVLKSIKQIENRRNKLYDKADKIIKKIDSEFDDVNDLIIKADQAAKELGIKPEQIPNYKKVDSAYGKIGELVLNDLFIDNPYF